MARDTDKAHEEHLEDLRDKEFEKFIESALRTQGRNLEEANWMDM